MRLARGYLLAVALVLAAGSVRGGDPDVADLLYKKAKKAFSARTYDDAEKCYRRAVREMSPFPEAWFGLAETLEKLERPSEAMDAYRSCVADIEAGGDPAKWKLLKSRAQSAVTRLLGRSADVAKLNDAFIRKCLDFGRKHADSDPAWARKAFETVLLLDPSNESAKNQLKLLPAEGAKPAPSKSAPSEGAFGEPLIRAGLWSGADEWSVGESSIVGDSPTEGKLFWLEESFEGRFSVRGSFRVTKTQGKYAFGVFFGSEGREPWWGIFFGRDGGVSLERCDVDTNHTAKDTILDGFDPAKEHTMQLDVRPGEVTVSVDGHELFELTEADRKTFDGKICLFVQRARIEWTQLGVKR